MTIPASGALSVTTLNSECEKPAGSVWRMGDSYSRVLAAKASGAVNYSDYRSKTWVGGIPVIGTSNTLESSGGFNVWQATGPNVDTFDFGNVSGAPQIRPNQGSFTEYTLPNGIKVLGLAAGWQDTFFDSFIYVIFDGSFTILDINIFLDSVEYSNFGSNTVFSPAYTTDWLAAPDTDNLNALSSAPKELMMCIDY